MQTTGRSPVNTWASRARLHDGQLPQQAAGYFACAFVNSPGCLHRELFEPHYQRANRINSTKILRCFPHCCPRHVSRSYCGSSLTVHVDVPVDCASPASQVHVLARFCVSDDQSPVGHTVPAHAVLSSIQSNDNTNGEWITSQLVTRDEGVWIFEVNPSRRWYYSWCSGKTNAQRYTLHKLEAVVAVEEGDMYRVVARTESTPFTITSFRRCMGKKDERQRPRQLTALEMSLLNKVVSEEAGVEVVRPVEISNSVAPLPVSPAEPFYEALGLVCTSVQLLELEKFRDMLPSWKRGRPAPSFVVVREGPAAVAANLLFWLTTDSTVEATIANYASQAADRLLDVPAVCHYYERCMYRLQDLTEQYLSECSTSFGIILSVARSVLHGNQAQQRLPHPFDWESFVARVRSHVVSQPQSQMSLVVSEDASEINGNWACVPTATRIVATGTIRSLDHVPVTVAVVFLQQLGAIQLRLNPATQSLTIRSAISGNRSGSRFVLDGKYRSCNLLPHGESTMSAGSILGGQCFGDFIGRSNENGSVDLTCYSWPASRWLDWPTRCDDCAYCWQWKLRASEDKSQLLVSLRVARGVVETGEGDAFACRRAIERVASFSRWSVAILVNFTYGREFQELKPWREMQSSR